MQWWSQWTSSALGCDHKYLELMLGFIYVNVKRRKLPVMLYGIFILFFALLLARNFYALEDKKGTEFVLFFFFLVSKTVPFCT